MEMVRKLTTNKLKFKNQLGWVLLLLLTCLFKLRPLVLSKTLSHI